MATAVELAEVEAGGLISEDVFPKLFRLTPVERPFIDTVGGTGADNYKKEFTDKKLAKPSSTNTLYENQDLSGIDDSQHGLRYYNLCQQMGKTIKTSQRGRDVKLTYDADEFLQQLMDAGEALRTDEEAAAVSRNAVTAEVPGASGALMAGAVTWAAISSNVTDGLAVLGAGGVASALDGATNVGGGPTTALQPGTKRPLTEDMFRSVLRAGWAEGARFTHAMAVGDLIESIGNYLFSSSARVATLTSDVPQSNRTGVTSGNGARQGGVVAQGAVNMFVGNFGVVTLTPNRQMEAYGSDDTADLLFVDPRYPMMATLHDYATKEIAQVGLYDQQVMYCDKTMIPGATRSLGVIADIDLLAPMVAV